MISSSEPINSASVATAIITTLRPSGNTGDQNESTAATASATNSSGVSVGVSVATSAAPLSNTGLGAREFSAVRFFVKATTSVSVGSTIDFREVVVKKGLVESMLAIQATGEWENAGSLRLDPGGLKWTGTSVDTVEVFVRIGALLAPAGSASLSVTEIRAEVVDFYVKSGGVAGYLTGVGEAQ